MTGTRDGSALRRWAGWLVWLSLTLVLGLTSAACGGASYESAAAPGGGAAKTAAEPEMMAAEEDYGESLDGEAMGDYDDAPMPMEAPEGNYAQITADVSTSRSANTGGQPAAQRPSPAPAPPPPPKSKSDGHKQIASPLLIYRADVHMAVFEAEKTLDAAEEMAKTMGGYLVRRSDNEIVIRVPARKFEKAMKSIGGMGDVLHRNVEVEDVTEKFYDLQVRLRNARAVRDRFQQLLKEAKTVKDSLAIEKELERITDKIESMEGKLKVLRELIAFSTITLRLQAQPKHQVPNVNLPFPWLRELGLPNLLRM